MDLLIEQIWGFEKRLKRLGYDGEFHVGNHFSGGVSGCLNDYLSQDHKQKKDCGPFSARLTTCTDQNGHLGNYTLCHFDIGYDLLAGFLITDMLVERKGVDNKVICEIDKDLLHKDGLIPTCSMVNEFVNPGVAKLPADIDLLVADIGYYLVDKGYKDSLFTIHPNQPADFRTALERHFAQNEIPHFPTSMTTQLTLGVGSLFAEYMIDRTATGHLIVPQVKTYQVLEQTHREGKVFQIDDNSQVPSKVDLIIKFNQENDNKVVKRKRTGLGI